MSVSRQFIAYGIKCRVLARWGFDTVMNRIRASTRFRIPHEYFEGFRLKLDFEWSRIVPFCNWLLWIDASGSVLDSCTFIFNAAYLPFEFYFCCNIAWFWMQTLYLLAYAACSRFGLAHLVLFAADVVSPLCNAAFPFLKSIFSCNFFLFNGIFPFVLFECNIGTYGLHYDYHLQ